MQFYISHPRGTVFYNLISFLSSKPCPIHLLRKISEIVRKYDILFNFRFTENMIFSSIAENQENMIFTSNVITKMLFFMQCCNLMF